MSGSGRVDSEAKGQAAQAIGYYGVPVIHGPHWKWLIICYFFLGGISGSSAAISAFARAFGGLSALPLARTATYISVAALAPCPVFLILDLGRPARFLNMLRAFRTSSPMSMGTWGLSAFGLFATLTAAMQIAVDHAEPAQAGKSSSKSFVLGGLAVLSGAFGLFIAGYTGVLLAATAVPLWSKRPALLGPLFLASAMTSGSAALGAATAIVSPNDRYAENVLRQFEAVSSIAEGALLYAWLAALGPTAKPLTQDLLGYVVRVGVLAMGMVAPLTVSAAAGHLPRRARRAATLIASALTLAGVFALRYAVVEGGRRSAQDPMATFEMTG